MKHFLGTVTLSSLLLLSGWQVDVVRTPAAYELHASYEAAEALPIVQQQSPKWVLPGAVYDFDFANKRFFNGYVWLGPNTQSKYAPMILYSDINSCVVAANFLYNQWQDGILRPSGQSGTSCVPRFSDYGLWIEGSPNGSKNWLQYSRNLTGAAWTATNATVTQTAVVGADAVSGNGSKITATAGNATVYQTIAFDGRLDLVVADKSTVVNGGTGGTYVANNVITLNDSCGTHGKITVNTVSGSQVLSTTNTTAGDCATALPSNPVAQLGAVTGGTQQTGTGATFNPFYRLGTLSCWMERVTGTGEIDLTTNNGSSFTNVTSQLNSTYYVQVRAPAIAMINNVVGIRIVTNTDVVKVDFCQMEDDDQASSPIVNATTTLNQRGGENVFLGTNGTNYNQGFQTVTQTQNNWPSAWVWTYSGNFGGFNTHGIVTSDTQLVVTGAIGGGTINASFGGHTMTSAASDVYGTYLVNNHSGCTLNKIAFSSDGFGGKICVNGSLPTKDVTVKPTTFSGSHNNLLNNGSNLLPANGYMARFTSFERGLSDDECVRYSTVINCQP